MFCVTPPGVSEPPETIGEAELGEPGSEVWCSGFSIETGSVCRTAASDVKAGLNIEEGFPETLANGFSIEAGIAFNLDAASTADGLTTEAACVVPPIRFGLEFWSVPGEEREAGGVSSGAVVSVAAPVISAVFGTTAPSVNVV